MQHHFHTSEQCRILDEPMTRAVGGRCRAHRNPRENIQLHKERTQPGLEPSHCEWQSLQPLGTPVGIHRHQQDWYVVSKFKTKTQQLISSKEGNNFVTQQGVAADGLSEVKPLQTQVTTNQSKPFFVLCTNALQNLLFWVVVFMRLSRVLLFIEPC